MNDETRGRGPFPNPPVIADEVLNRCRETGDYRPVLFEWYNFVGQVCFRLASLRAPALHPLQPPHFAVLFGLLNRCARLMLSNLKLSCDADNRNGETTVIIDRCLYESAIKVLWLCKTGSAENFDSLIAAGLQTELELRREIEAHIAERGGDPVVIEKRMLASISKCISSSGLSEQQIKAAKKLPDLASMLTMVGLSRLEYVVGQRMGSHHIHGTWSSLWFHYIDVADDGTFELKDKSAPMDQNEYLLALIVLRSLKAFVEFVVPAGSIATSLIEMLDSIEEEIVEIHDEMVAGDYEVA